MNAKRPAFTLMELVVSIVILMMMAAVSLPMLGALMRETRLANAVSRLKAGLQQTRAILTDYAMANRTDTAPRIPGAVYTGTALVVRWDDLKQDYDIFYAICAQNAVGSAGPADFLASRPTPLRGYEPFLDLEPMTLGTGLRVAGLRRHGAKAGGLELVPGDSFAVCVDPTGMALPPDATIYVNLQEAPPSGIDGPWGVWDTAMYDGVKADGSFENLGGNPRTTGAYAATYALNGGTGEGFNTSLPVLVVYRDDDLPMTGVSPSGTPWRVANPGGTLVVNPALNPNELLARTKGKLVMLTMQGGSTIDY